MGAVEADSVTLQPPSQIIKQCKTTMPACCSHIKKVLEQHATWIVFGTTQPEAAVTDSVLDAVCHGEFGIPGLGSAGAETSGRHARVGVGVGVCGGGGGGWGVGGGLSGGDAVGRGLMTVCIMAVCIIAANIIDYADV